MAWPASMHTAYALQAIENSPFIRAVRQAMVQGAGSRMQQGAGLCEAPAARDRRERQASLPCW